MKTAEVVLARIRQIRERIVVIIDQDERTALMQAELVHQAAHLVEHVGELDVILLAGGHLPNSWAKARPTHGLTQAINEAAQEPR